MKVEQVVLSDDAPALKPFLHFHESAELIWFKHAQGTVFTEIGELAITDGTMLFLPPMSAHDFRLAGGASTWVMAHFDFADLAIDSHEANSLAHVLIHRPKGLCRVRMAIAFDWLVTLAGDPERSYHARALARVLLREFPETADAKVFKPSDSVAATIGPGSQRLQPALDLVAANEGMVTIEEAAASCHLSRAYFSRAFPAKFGMGFGEYARQYRLRVAASKLANSSTRISEIGYASGFLSPAHFSSSFRKVYGLSPSRFRRRHSARPA